MIRLGRVGLAVLLLVWVTAPMAFAQEEYAGETGDLEDVEMTIIVSFFGDGFAAGSTVLLTLTSVDTEEEIDLGMVGADADGAIFEPVTLPPNLEPGLYILAATGVTEDSATRVLTAEVWIVGDVAKELPDASTTTSSTSEATTTLSTLSKSILKALLAGLDAVRGAV